MQEILTRRVHPLLNVGLVIPHNYSKSTVHVPIISARANHSPAPVDQAKRRLPGDEMWLGSG